jgi:CDP-glucose 4,6-dehydratase
MDDLDFYLGRRVLITGHTGFKGSWLTMWLRELGAIVSGFSLDVPTSPSLFETLGLAGEVRHSTGDVRDLSSLQRVIDEERPEVIFHLAAQPLVRRGYQRPKETFDVNVGGTVNLLEAARRAAGVRSVLCVTSDKCYDHRGANGEFRETDPLGGSDPYSASKAAAEFAVAAYRESFFTPASLSGRAVGLASVRAGNVIGGGDWAEDRIVSDCIRALARDEPILVRQPEAIRPWQHVLEPLAGYLILAARLAQEPRTYSGAWNFGPNPDRDHTVAELVSEIQRLWPKTKRVVRAKASKPQQSTQHFSLPETACLRLCSDKAIANLPWHPQWAFHATVRRTVEWYLAFYRGAGRQELRELCRQQIGQYQARWTGIRSQESGVTSQESGVWESVGKVPADADF